MTAEFNWWLLLVGLVVGAGLTWLVLAEFGPVSNEPAAEETEAQLEADWIAARFEERGEAADRGSIAATLELDRLYRSGDPRLAPTRPRPRRAPVPDDAGGPEAAGAADGVEAAEARGGEPDRTRI